MTAPRTVIVQDKIQQGYRCWLTEPMGANFTPEFRPELTPAHMQQLGVFCGKYMTDTRNEFPEDWFTLAKLAPLGRDCSLNFSASMPASRCRCGRKNDGFLPTTRPVGFNGIAAITWAAASANHLTGQFHLGIW